MARNPYCLVLLAGVALAACSSSSADEPAAAAAQTAAPAADAAAPVVTPASHADTVAAPDSAAAAAAAAVATRTDSLRGELAAGDERPEIVRETFTYSGGARDPFSSLLTMERRGPELVDLQLVAVYQDLQYPGNSVAIIRDKVSDRRYKVRAGDEMGDLRVREVRAKDVVIAVQDFGYSRQEILSLRKQEDVTP